MWYQILESLFIKKVLSDIYDFNESVISESVTQRLHEFLTQIISLEYYLSEASSILYFILFVSVLLLSHQLKLLILIN